jgi:hypothetical protein
MLMRSVLVMCFGFKKRFPCQKVFAKKAKRATYPMLSGNSGLLKGDNVSKARTALVVLGDAMLLATVVLLLEIDKLVNGTLYNYGLVFSYEWAQPYWLMFRLSLVLIIIAIVLVTVVELPHPAFQEETEQEAQ